MLTTYPSLKLAILFLFHAAKYYEAVHSLLQMLLQIGLTVSAVHK